MADTIITITIKSGDNAELLATGRHHYGKELTAAEVVEAFRLECISELRWKVKEYRKSLRDPVETPTIGE